jgi:hypothetical protein
MPPAIWIFVMQAHGRYPCASARKSWAFWVPPGAPAIGKWQASSSIYLARRVLVSFYPQPDATARDCACKLAAVALGGAVAMRWDEVHRIAELPEYRNLPECKSLVREVANELGIPSPFNTD